MSSQENMEALYTMFSRLLDRKVEELHRIQAEGIERRENNDDIKVMLLSRLFLIFGIFKH